MAQNITLLGASYSDVPAVQLPKTGGGTATFTDVTDTTAAAADVATGKYFYTAAGVFTQGTASGGGGGGWTKIGNTTELAVNTTSTSAASAGTISIGSSYYTDAYIIYVRIRDKEGKRNNYFYGSDSFFINYYKASSQTQTLSVAGIIYYKYASNAYTGYTGSYGVYGYSINSSGTLTIRKRYSSSNTTTINSTYLIDVYYIAPPQALFG